MTTQVTTGLTKEMQVYYESVFLERAKYALVHDQGAQKRSQGANEGSVIRFSRYDPLSSATTALTEGSNPADVDIVSSNVDASLAEYGSKITISKALKLESIDVNAREKVELIGQNMGETIDELTRNAIYSGATAQLAGGKTLVSDVAASNTLSATELRKAVRTLKTNRAIKYPDGFFVGKVGPYTAYDLMGDSTWIAAKEYSDVKDLYAGEMGELYGARLLETTNQKSESSTVTIYSNFIHGANAFGCYDLEGDTPKLYIKTPGPNSTDNAADRFSTIAWAGAYVTKVLVANWIINIKSGATA
jgi:N4-gp56 family major capsid protein